MPPSRRGEPKSILATVSPMVVEDEEGSSLIDPEDVELRHRPSASGAGGGRATVDLVPPRRGSYEEDLSPPSSSTPSLPQPPASSNGESGGGSTPRAVAPLSIESRYEAERLAAKERHWRESPYAVGLVEATWDDERRHRFRRRPGADAPDANGPNREPCADACDDEMDPTCGCLFLSGMVCSRLGAGRVGNMVVLREKSVTVEEFVPPEEGSAPATTTRKVRKNVISIVVGPYWPMMAFVTYPLILFVSGWTAYRAMPGKHPLFVAAWTACTLGLIYALFGVGCRDPGILPRHHNVPPEEECGRGGAASWRWNDQAQTYRPRGAIYDPDCAVVIEEFDHTCPWTGTAIGKKNMCAFQAFVALVFLCLIMDILLLTGAF